VPELEPELEALSGVVLDEPAGGVALGDVLGDVL
jgi:hypothetical protein